MSSALNWAMLLWVLALTGTLCIFAALVSAMLHLAVLTIADD